MMYPSGSAVIPVQIASSRKIRVAVVCLSSSDGPYPLTTIWTTAGETFEMTVSSELSKAPSKFDDAPAFETNTGAFLAVLPAVDCASATVAVRKHATTPYFIHCNLVIT